MAFTLSDRDRRVLMILGGFFGLVLIYLLASWALGGTGGGSVAEKQRQLSEIIQSYRTFTETQAAFDLAEKDMSRAGDVELLTELESLAAKANVRDKIVAIDRRSAQKNPYYEEDSVEARLERITIEQLVNYLYELEYSPKVIRIKEMHIEVLFQDKNLMNVKLLVSKFQSKAGGASAS
ncbi:hypothetical protein K8I61_02385 [bacterium]|nr:hypothetical protein [bacterium]